MKSLPDRIADKVHDFTNKIVFLEKKNILKFEGVNLYPSEIHLLFVVSEEPINATKMAEQLRVTKGAVSQTISRLEKKGILIKEKDPFNKNEITLTFTPLGRRIFEHTRKISSSMSEKMKESITDFNHEELEIINKFLERMNELFVNLN